MTVNKGSPAAAVNDQGTAPGRCSPKLRIAVFGAGCIGSTLAWHLARDGGHDLTVVARGARLTQLQTDNAILNASNDRAEVTVAAELDKTVPYDLLLVPVKCHQVAQALPALQASAATTIMFNSVTFTSLAQMREAVGAERFAYGFPKFPAFMKEGKLVNTKISSSTPIIVTENRWAQVFKDANIPSSLSPCDMDSYMRAHIAAATPLLTMCCIAHQRGAGITHAEARTHAKAQAEGFAIVSQLGLSIPRAGLNWMSKTPLVLNAFIFWLASRLLPADFQELLSTSAQEAAWNIKEMSDAAPGKAIALHKLQVQ